MDAGHQDRRRTLALVLLLAALASQGLAQERDRSAIPDQYKWNLADLYPSIDAWRAARDTIAADLPRLRQFEGRLNSPSALADALDARFGLDKEITRASGYASMLADADTRDTTHQGMRQEMTQLRSEFRAEAAYIEPEILSFEPGLVDRFLGVEPRLNAYRVYLADIARRARHTLSSGEEKILAGAGPLAGSPAAVFNILSNAEFPYPTVRLSDGTAVTVNQANFTAYRGSANRRDRQTVMSAFFESLGSFSRTLGTTMNGSVQKLRFWARARNYPSSLDLALDEPNIPVSVYTRLIEGVNRHLPSFHRYLRLRKRLTGLEDLHYYDLYAPLVGSADRMYSPEEAQQHVLAAVAPLGSDYRAVVQRAFRERWVDLFPSPGKRSGAYSNGGAYDVHPYVLINYNGKYDDVSTIAHELGHAMHSHFSNGSQPYPMADHPIFVAEVASTFNESLLIDHMLETAADDETRLGLLGHYLEGVKGTLFRQAQLAEFELRMHDMAEEGRAITGDALARLYLDITRKYYGHDQGVCVVDDYIAHEWSYIPHFYRDFYVFQYATSFVASEALAQQVKEGDRAAVERYLAFLSAGGSKYPIDLLKDAGVDMTTDEPLELTVRRMNRVMDQMEELLGAPGTIDRRP